MARMKEAMKKARKHAEELERIAARSKPKPRLKPTQDEAFVKRVARKLRELYYGPRTYLPKKKPVTVATKKVERGLRQADISKKKIKQLRD